MKAVDVRAAFSSWTDNTENRALRYSETLFCTYWSTQNLPAFRRNLLEDSPTLTETTSCFETLKPIYKIVIFWTIVILAVKAARHSNITLRSF